MGMAYVINHQENGGLAKRTEKRTVIPMHSVPATQARSQLYKLIDAVAHEPIQITGKRGNAVLVSEEDWSNIQETLYLSAIPGMSTSIKKGLKTPARSGSKKLKW